MVSYHHGLSPGGDGPRKYRKRISVVLHRVADGLMLAAIVADTQEAATWAMGARVTAGALRVAANLASS
ncbi:hypothetical protein P9990_27090 (plasmid) [Prescottella equi]|uniref:hypothetical protein n=1 Tax=Rhodococcus hoagii TaxID=43767 RepID=UPI00257869CC|nr:hypothetical protein [Prescottella equi]WJJ14648.1 hypothetical protein P9990_27090 [Prescottella equi]